MHKSNYEHILLDWTSEIAGLEACSISCESAGAGLVQLLQAAQNDCEGGLPVGTRVWAKVRGFCPWPGVVWSTSLMRKGDLPDLLRSYQPGSKLVHFYGEHSCSWCTSLQPCAPLLSKGDAAGVSQPTITDNTVTISTAVPIAPAPEDTAPSNPDTAALLWADDVGSDTVMAMGHDTHVDSEHDVEEVPVTDMHAQRLEDMREWGKKFQRVKLVAAALWEMDGCLEEGPAEVCRVLRLSEVWGPSDDVYQQHVCCCCGGNKAEVSQTPWKVCFAGTAAQAGDSACH